MCGKLKSFTRMSCVITCNRPGTSVICMHLFPENKKRSKQKPASYFSISFESLEYRITGYELATVLRHDGPVSIICTSIFILLRRPHIDKVHYTYQSKAKDSRR